MTKQVFNRPYDYIGDLPDVVFPPSPTVPDMSLSISEILRRYVNNEPIPQDIIGQPHYNAGVLSPMSRKGVDLADWSAMMKDARSAVSEGVMQAKREERMKRQQEEALKAAEQQPQNPPAPASE